MLSKEQHNSFCTTNPLTMFRRKDMNAAINGYLSELEELGFPVNKAYVFGSMVNRNPHAYSDIDVAVWSEKFGHNYFKIIEQTAVLKKIQAN